VYVSGRTTSPGARRASPESAAQGWPGFASYRERFRAVEEAVAAGAPALKTIAAYRCGLDLPGPDVHAASAGYDR
jgi:hypothetical protein